MKKIRHYVYILLGIAGFLSLLVLAKTSSAPILNIVITICSVIAIQFGQAGMTMEYYDRVNYRNR